MYPANFMSSASDVANMIAFRFTANYTAGHALKHTTYFTSGLRMKEACIMLAARNNANFIIMIVVRKN